VFAETSSIKNKKSFLTHSQIVKFYKQAFLKISGIEKLLFNCSRNEKGFIRMRFYEFYLIASEYDSSRQDKYIKLLTENFEGWDFEYVKSNFSKKVKRQW
jgi:hypothetical protein